MKIARIIVTVVLFSVVLSASPCAHSGEGEKGLFTKHFQETLFAIGEKGRMSIEILLNDREYAIGKDVIGVVVHDSHDEDVEGAGLQAFLSSSEGQKEISGIREKGGGLYLIPSGQLPKSGAWELRIDVKKKIGDSARLYYSDSSHAPLPAGKYDRKAVDTHIKDRAR